MTLRRYWPKRVTYDHDVYWRGVRVGLAVGAILGALFGLLFAGAVAD